MKLKHLLVLSPLFWSACSSIDQHDCNSNMHELGLRHGRMGSAKKYTDEIRNTCSNRQSFVDIDQYEIGFKSGWQEFCRPANAFVMGKADDQYVSFCPENKEKLFREKFLIGKQINELKNHEEELSDEIEELKEELTSNDDSQVELKRLEKNLFEIRKHIQLLEIEGLKDTLTLMNHL